MSDIIKIVPICLVQFVKPNARNFTVFKMSKYLLIEFTFSVTIAILYTRVKGSSFALVGRLRKIFTKKPKNGGQTFKGPKLEHKTVI